MPPEMITRDIALAIRGPAIVLTDNMFSLVSSALRIFQRKLGHSSGQYQHAMWLLEAGQVVSQNWKLQRANLRDYLTGKHRVKIVVARDWTTEERDEIRRRIRTNLILATTGYYRYDWLGVLSHLFRCSRINFPNRFYCSEHVASILRRVDRRCPIRPSPAQLNAYLKSRPEKYIVLGVFDPYQD